MSVVSAAAVLLPTAVSVTAHCGPIHSLRMVFVYNYFSILFFRHIDSLTGGTRY